MNKPLSVAVLTKSFARSSSKPIEHLEEKGIQVFLRPNDSPEDEEQVARLIGDADAAIVSAQDRVGRLVFDRCPNLKAVADHAVGFDRIDMDEAERRGIKVRTCPGNHESVADLTWGLILATSRNLLGAAMAVRDGGWKPTAFIGLEVFGKTLGIVGYGEVGRAVARRAVGFQNRILVSDPFVRELPPVAGTAVELVDLDQLLADSDIVTLHMPLGPDTEKIIDQGALGRMKEGAILVNTSRGGLVDETALREALDSGRVRMAGMDVFAQEPPVGNPLAVSDKVIPTPHMGAQTVEANLRMGMMAAEFVAGILLD